MILSVFDNVCCQSRIHFIFSVHRSTEGDTSTGADSSTSEVYTIWILPIVLAILLFLLFRILERANFVPCLPVLLVRTMKLILKNFKI